MSCAIMALSRDHESLRFPRGYAAVSTCCASYTPDKKAAGGELFSRLVKGWDEWRRRTEAVARSRSFVFCALDWRQHSFV